MDGESVMFCYREGESVYPEELVLYALLKLTGSPLYSAAPVHHSELETVIKYNAGVVCNSLKLVFNRSYQKEDLYYYLCLMKQLTDAPNKSRVGQFCGEPRDRAFEPYVTLFLSKTASQLSVIINSETGSVAASVAAAGVKEEALSICEQIREGVSLRMEESPQVVFSGLWLSIAKFPGWKYEQSDRELLLWKPCVGRPYVAEKVVRVFDDLSYEIEIPGRKTSHQEGLTTSQSVLSNILKNVDQAVVCQGIPKQHIPPQHLAPHIPARPGSGSGSGSVQVYDDVSGSLVARDNGDFLLSEECQGLVLGGGKKTLVLQQQFPKVCSSCVDLVAYLARRHLSNPLPSGDSAPPGDHRSFEAETLSLIARLNIELSERKQQVVSLWQRFSAQRDANRRLTRQLEDRGRMEGAVVTVGDEWLEKHLAQKQELEERS